jgi:hypothetical protein
VRRRALPQPAARDAGTITRNETRPRSSGLTTKTSAHGPDSIETEAVCKPSFSLYVRHSIHRVGCSRRPQHSSRSRAKSMISHPSPIHQLSRDALLTSQSGASRTSPASNPIRDQSAQPPGPDIHPELDACVELYTNLITLSDIEPRSLSRIPPRPSAFHQRPPCRLSPFRSGISQLIRQAHPGMCRVIY